MRVLLTNDDGIDAPGIQALYHAVKDLGQQRPDLLPDLEIYVVAPQSQQSGCGHQLTVYGPMAVDARDAHHFAVAGTPADCVRLGYAELVKEVSWVFSGINAGSNLGADIYTSGTVAAVREAALLRIPAVALSLHTDPQIPEDWPRVSGWATTLLEQLLSQTPEPGSYWNINFPTLSPNLPDPDTIAAIPCTRALPIAFEKEGSVYHYTGRYADRARDPGADTDECMGRKQITMTLLRL